MDRDERKLVCHLFAQAAGILEHAHEAAAEGQSARLKAKGYRKQAELLHRLAQDAAAIAEAVQAVAREPS